MDNKKEYIICSAVHFDDGNKYIHQPWNLASGIVIAGMRHHNCLSTFWIIRQMLTPGSDFIIKKQKQGFLTSLGRFVGRHMAYTIAVDMGQIEDNKTTKILYSEDLY